MELIWYCFIFILSLIFTLKRELIRNKNLFQSIVLLFYLVTSILVRNTNLDNDISHYADAMESISLGLFYIKEPIVWFGQAFLFRVLQEPITVFIVTDMILFILMLTAFNLLRVPQYIYFSIFLYFPFFAGFQNVYRQFAAVIIFIFSLSLLARFRKFKQVAVFSSVLAHNVAGLFIYLIFYKSKSRLVRAASFMFIPVLPIIIYFAAASKSTSSTGLSLEWIYVLAFIFTLVFVLIFHGFFVNSKNKDILIMLLYFAYLSMSSAILLESAQAERVGIFALLLFYVFFSKYLEAVFKQKIFVRIMYVTITSWLIFTFSSMQVMLVQ